MTYAVVLRVAPADAAQVRLNWSAAARFEPAPSMDALGYPPHVTLTVADSLNPEPMITAMQAVFSDAAPVVAVFDTLRYFETEPLVLWIAPRDASPWHRMQRALLLAMPGTCVHGYYGVDDWVPHLTLATAIPVTRREAAMAHVARQFSPLSLTFDAAECVHVPDVSTVSRIGLGEPA